MGKEQTGIRIRGAVAMSSSSNTVEPPVMYKYLSADRAVEVLPENGNGALRATQPASLNDPLECATRCSAVYPTEDQEIREMLEVLNWIVPEHPLTTSDVQLSRRQLGSQAWNDLLRKRLSIRFGVVAFSSSALHPLLWAHYADSGAGVVIGYRVSILREATSGYERLGAVQYLEEPPVSGGHVIFKDEGNLHAILLTKASYWNYEQEWRLTMELKNTIGTGKEDRSGNSINLCPISNEAVTEVYVTERTSPATVETLEARLKNPSNRYRARVTRKLILAQNKYGYDV